MPGRTLLQETFGATYGGTAAENYERFFVPAIGAPLAEDLVARAELRPGDRVLDVACGTGIVARLAAERVGAHGSVSGLDVNAGMLSVARSLAPSAGAPIRWYEDPAESIPLPDASFDVVLCQLGLQFMADRGAALREMRRVLVPGGRLLVSLPAPGHAFQVLEDALAQDFPAGAGFVRTVFSLHDPTEIEKLFRDAGLREVAVRTETKLLRLPPPRDFLWQYVHSTPLAGVVAAADPERAGELERKVVEGWRGSVREGRLTCEQEVVTASGRA